MKKLTINKMNEYPTIDLDEQKMIKGGYGLGPIPIGWVPELIALGISLLYGDDEPSTTTTTNNGIGNASSQDGILNLNFQINQNGGSGVNNPQALLDYFYSRGIAIDSINVNTGMIYPSK